MSIGGREEERLKLSKYTEERQEYMKGDNDSRSMIYNW